MKTKVQYTKPVQLQRIGQDIPSTCVRFGNPVFPVSDIYAGRRKRTSTSAHSAPLTEVVGRDGAVREEVLL